MALRSCGSFVQVCAVQPVAAVLCSLTMSLQSTRSTRSSCLRFAAPARSAELMSPHHLITSFSNRQVPSLAGRMHGCISQGSILDAETDDPCATQNMMIQTGKNQGVRGMHGYMHEASLHMLATKDQTAYSLTTDCAYTLGKNAEKGLNLCLQ